MVSPQRDKLCGEIEVDEIFIGGPKPGKRGRGASGKELVLVAAEKDGKRIGRVRLVHISDATAETLNMALGGIIKPGSTIYTDGWAGYSTKQLQALGHAHVIVRTNAHLGDNLLPFANIIASLLKRWLLGTLRGEYKRRTLAIIWTSLHFASTVEPLNLGGCCSIDSWKMLSMLLQQ